MRPVRPVAFAHNAEAELAALLDFYGIEWEYEPTTFVLDRGARRLPHAGLHPGLPTCPAFGCYLEVTTLEQRLVTRKNRKVRLLRELHPEIDVRIIYQRDYHHLIVKYGLAPPEQHVARGGGRGDGAAGVGRARRWACWAARAGRPPRTPATQTGAA